jgi:5-methylcytosine-specific restriction endonuclease McrA
MNMTNFQSITDLPEKIHTDELWTASECYRFYTQQRQQFCTLMDTLDLWLLAPYCTECGMNDTFICRRDPDVLPDSWELDLLWEVGPTTIERTQNELKKDSDFSYHCKHCFKELRPWHSDEIYIVAYHLEEHYNIPIETPTQRKANKKLRKQIIKLYENKCFGCGNHKPLHIDHIIPQSKGGSGAFRNLQPLCEECGNKKSNDSPNEIEIFSTIYFDKYPLDSSEGLFWK